MDRRTILRFIHLALKEHLGINDEEALSLICSPFNNEELLLMEHAAVQTFILADLIR